MNCPEAESHWACSASMKEMQTSIASLNDAVQSILESNAGISCPVRNTSAGYAASQLAPSMVTNASGTVDNALTIPPPNSQTSNPRQKTRLSYEAPKTAFGLAGEVEYELSASRAYLRTAQRHSQSSLPSAADKFRWSILSGLRLTEVSDLSIISLPLSVDELWNPECYRWSQMINHHNDHADKIRTPELLETVAVDDPGTDASADHSIKSSVYARLGSREDLRISRIIDRPSTFFILGRVYCPIPTRKRN